MAGVRFEDVDLLGALSRVVDLHTQHYKEDFDLDKELIPCVNEKFIWMAAMKTKCGGFTRNRQMIPFWLMPSL